MRRPVKRILITGAAGLLGGLCRDRLAGDFDLIRLSDINPMAPARDTREEVVIADLADGVSIAKLCEGIDAIVHFGGVPVERPWEMILPANIIGNFNIWEGARKAGVDRVIFASSNHAIGFYRRTERLDHNSSPRPDGRYGLSKAYGEDLARFYAYKYGVRGFMMRIGSCLPEPNNERCLSTWLSFDDCIRLVRTGLAADYLYEVVYGVSRNTRSWWDNANAYRLGYDPRDDAEHYASKLAGVGIGDDQIGDLFMGGPFTSDEFSGDPSRVP